MTIYIHFNIRSGKASERLHNVASVHDNGSDSISVKGSFTDGATVYRDVSHVAIQPDKE